MVKSVIIFQEWYFLFLESVYMQHFFWQRENHCRSLEWKKQSGQSMINHLIFHMYVVAMTCPIREREIFGNSPELKYKYIYWETWSKCFVVTRMLVMKSHVDIVFLSSSFVRMLSRGVGPLWILQGRLFLAFTWNCDALKFEEKVEIMYIGNAFVIHLYFALFSFKPNSLIWSCFDWLE